MLGISDDQSWVMDKVRVYLTSIFTFDGGEQHWKDCRLSNLLLYESENRNSEENVNVGFVVIVPESEVTSMKMWFGPVVPPV